MELFMSYLGGTRAPLMFDCEMWDSWPKTKAEWQKPDSWRYRYTRKFTSSVEKDILMISDESFPSLAK